MKVLITGGSGLLGQFLNERLSKEYDILTTWFSNSENCREFNSVKLDIGSPDELTSVFTTFMPDAFIHTGAYSRPEICNKLSKEEVFRINVKATENILDLCNKYHARLIFTSTDLVYDGTLGSALSENDKLLPLTLYAESKAEAEKVITANSKNFIILRTALLYGIGKNDSVNNFHKMYNNFKAGKSSRLFYDQFRTPLSLIEAADIIARLLKKDVCCEIVNFGGQERMSRVELGEILCDAAGFDKALIESVSMKDVPSLVQVPDVSLNTDKLKSLGIKLKSVEESVFEILRRLNG